MINLLLVWINILSTLLIVKSEKPRMLTYLETGIRNQVNETTSTNAASTNATSINPQTFIGGTYLKAAPSFIPQMQSNTSICFVKLQNIMGYFSDYEQAALINAARENTQSDRCFDCEVYKKYLTTAIKRYIEELSNQISKNRATKKNGFGCFLNFIMPGIEPLINASLTETVLSYLYYYSETNVCISQFLMEMGKVLLERRRFLCTTISNMEKVAINDTSGKIVGFKWTQPHANAMTNSLVKLAACINKERAIIPQTTINAISTISLSESCHISGKNYSGLNSTNFTGVLPQGRRLFSNVRFLQLATNATNATTTPSSEANATTSTTTPTADSNATIGTTESSRNINETLTTPPSPNTTNTHAADTNTTNATTFNQPSTNATTIPPVNTNATVTSPGSSNVSNATTSSQGNINANTTSPAISSATDATNLASTNSTNTIPSSSETNNSTITNPASSNQTTTPPPGYNSTNATTTSPIGSATSASSSNNNTSNEILSPNTTATETNITQPDTNLLTNRTDHETPGNLTETFVLSSNDTPDISHLKIAPSLPNDLLLTPGLNKINKYLTLNTGSKRTPVVINNLLNFTNNEVEIYQSISDFAKAILTKNKTLYSDLALNLNNSLLSSYSFQCMPKGTSIFLMIIKNNSRILTEFQKINCTERQDYIITITNGTVNCDNCDQSLLQNQLNFPSKPNLPKEYFFSTGCTNGTRFNFGTYKDFTGIPFASYERDTVNMDNICLKKAFTCASNQNAEYCPQNFMTTTCRDHLTNRCNSSGLFPTIKSLNNINDSFIIPEECSLDRLSLLINDKNTTADKNYTGELSESYVKSCFNWFVRNVFINAFNPNITKFGNLDNFFDSKSLQSSPIRRMLQTTTNETKSAFNENIIIPESEDPTVNDPVANTINDMTLNVTSAANGGATESTPESELSGLLNPISTTTNNNTTVNQPSPQPQPQPLPGTINAPYFPPNNNNYLYVHTLLYTFLVTFLFMA